MAEETPNLVEDTPDAVAPPESEMRQSFDSEASSIPTPSVTSTETQDDSITSTISPVSRISDDVSNTFSPISTQSVASDELSSASEQKDLSSMSSSKKTHEEKKKHACAVLYNLSDAEVLSRYKDLERNLQRVRTENGVFYRFLEKNDPEPLEDMTKVLQQEKMAKKWQKGAKKATLFSKPISRKSSVQGQPVSREQEAPKININQKSDLVMRDLEQFQAHMGVKNSKLYKVKCNLIAMCEENETRSDELDKSIQDLETFKQTNEDISLQKFARFMDEWSKRSRLMADKIRLRHSTLKVQYQKLSATLAHKQLIGENLQEIDFENLKVENTRINEKIDMKSLLLIELKKMTGAGNLKLAQRKQVLQEKVVEKQGMTMAIKRVEKDISKCDDEIVKLYPELERVKQVFTKVKAKFRSYETPDLITYVKKKTEVDGLKKEMKMWSRRKQFKEMVLGIEIKFMKKILHCKEPHPSWFE
ncbi:hypothetical protein Zmor_009168 [Zophobas morio]|uniref:Cilia- and flagella-associated protein 263 n=1 Tax=Zophobas morio TaxID=2755281 RepID=A0AA38IG01_9CUCU|nr:hypothetical protein Zmor_009168 [Zophobas morio]